MTPLVAGNMLNNEHSNPTTAPTSIVAGINRKWSEVRSSKRATCGTTSPIKPIGPQNDVTTAVSTPRHHQQSIPHFPQIDAKILSIPTAQQQCIERFYHSKRQTQSCQYNNRKQRKPLKRDSGKISHSPNHKE